MANWLKKLFQKDISMGTVARITQVYTTNINNVKSYVDEGYAGNAGVYAIINLVARKFASIPFYVYDVKDLKSLKKYKQLSSALYRSASKDTSGQLEELKSKAVDLYTDTDEISLLLQRPNQYQGIYDLMEQFMGWKQIGGGTYLWGQPRSASRKDPVELHVLPGKEIRIQGDKSDINKVTEYNLQSLPEKKFSGDEVLRWIYWSPYWDAYTRSHLYGLSPIKAAALNVDGYNLADKAFNQSFTNRGAEGFLFGKNVTIPPDKVDKLQGTLDDRFNGFMNRGNVIAFGSEVGYAQVGLSAEELQILQAKQYSFETLCNVFGVPPQCFADDKGATFNNKSTAMTQLVTNKIIPEWCSFRDMLNPWLLPKFGAEGQKFIDFDVSELPELQKDISALATALNTAWWLTGNEKRAAMEYEAIPEENMEKIIMPGNMPIESIGVEPEPEGDEKDYLR